MLKELIVKPKVKDLKSNSYIVGLGFIAYFDSFCRLGICFPILLSC